MKGFDYGEILRAVLLALSFGVGYAVYFSFFSCLLGVFKIGREVFRRIFIFDKIFPLPRFRDLNIPTYQGAAFSFISVLFFAVGFSLLSYLALDGEIRAYMLFLSFAAFYLSKFAFLGFLKGVFGLIIRLLLRVISLFARPFIFLIYRLHEGRISR